MRFLVLSILLIAVKGFEPLEGPAGNAQSTTTESWRLYNSTELEILLRGIPKSLQFLGTSPDGKAIFVDNTTTATWQGARSLCEAANLNLLSILSRSQLDFVTNTASSGGNGEYWIAARENRVRANSFTWDRFPDTPPAYYNSWGYFTEQTFPYLLCVNIYTREGSKGLMAARECTLQRWYLCEA